jgi:hypothetical protein
MPHAGAASIARASGSMVGCEDPQPIITIATLARATRRLLILVLAASAVAGALDIGGP